MVISAASDRALARCIRCGRVGLTLFNTGRTPPDGSAKRQTKLGAKLPRKCPLLETAGVSLELLDALCLAAHI
jgi:hypothetical protein